MTTSSQLVTIQKGHIGTSRQFFCAVPLRYAARRKGVGVSAARGFRFAAFAASLYPRLCSFAAYPAAPMELENIKNVVSRGLFLPTSKLCRGYAACLVEVTTCN